MRSCLAGLVALFGHSRARHLLLGFSLLVCATLSIGAVLLILDMRRSTLAEARRDLGNLAFVLSLAIDHTLQGLDLVQLSIAEAMRQAGIDTPEASHETMASSGVHQNLRDRIAALAHVDSVSLFDHRERWTLT